MTEELQELEAIQELPMAAGFDGSTSAPRSGNGAILGAPAFNPAADKEYYRFLFAGVVMFLGCLMPWGPEWSMAGYKTLGGAFYTLIAIAMIWSWWGAIATGRFSGANLKWVAASLIPLVFTLSSLLSAFEAPAVKDFVAMGKSMPSDWGDFLSAFGKSLFPFFGADAAAEAGEKSGNFLRAFGAGQIVLFFGALYAEFAMLLAIMGGAKTAKAQKAAGASSRRKR